MAPISRGLGGRRRDDVDPSRRLQRKGRRAVTHVRRQFGPVEGLHANKEGLEVASTDGRWLLGVAVGGSAMAFLDGTVVNVALPDIGRDLGAGMSELQWVLNAYLLALAALILLGGSLGDRFGRVRIFLIGIVLFSLASGVCAAAPDVDLLVGARALQGVGAALLTPGSLALIETCMRPSQRARAIGLWSGLSGVAGALGPLAGGYLVGALSWRAVFLVNLPVGVVVAWAAIRHIPETRDYTASGQLDYLGAGLLALGLAGVTFALIEAPRDGAAMDVAAVAALGLIALAAFAWQERRDPDPLLPFEIFRSRQFSAANAVTFVVYAGLGGFFFLFVSFLQVSLGYSPVEAGAASLPVTAVMLMFSAWSGKLTERLGARLPLALGSLIIGAALLAMTTMSPGDDYLTGVFPPVLLFGVGLTLVVAPGTAAALGSADASRAGIASGINNAVARVAGLLAVAGLPVLVGITGDRFYEPATMVSGFHVAMTVCAALAAAGGVLAWFTITGTLSTAPRTIDRELPPGERFGCPIGEPNVCSGPVGPSREPGTDGPGQPLADGTRPIKERSTPDGSGRQRDDRSASPQGAVPSAGIVTDAVGSGSAPIASGPTR
jgi:EmrB/QacA subfamily drug resistance transporter